MMTPTMIMLIVQIVALMLGVFAMFRAGIIIKVLDDMVFRIAMDKEYINARTKLVASMETYFENEKVRFLEMNRLMNDTISLGGDIEFCLEVGARDIRETGCPIFLPSIHNYCQMENYKHKAHCLYMM